VNLRRLLCAALLLAASVVAGQSAAPTTPAQTAAQKPDGPLRELQVECTPASGAAQLIGKHGCVAGRVFRVTVHKGGNTHVSLCPARKCSFLAVVSGHDRARVGDLYYLRGKVIAVLGDVTESGSGHPIITVTAREQIRVAAGNPPPEFDAAQARPATNGRTVAPFGKNNRAW
jgi:hypothetical protein